MQANREPRLDFECFVQARAASLFRTAVALSCQDRAEAEDLLQVCLERTYRHWHRIASQGGDPERYARRILVNAAVDRRRWLRRRPEWPLSAAGAGPSVPDQVGKVADRDALLRALVRLPARQRSALVLRYFDDLDDTEIAAALGCSPGTVRSHLSRGLARMRQVLGENPAERKERARP